MLQYKSMADFFQNIAKLAGYAIRIRRHIRQVMYPNFVFY